MQSNPTNESQAPAAPLRLLLVEDDVVDRMALLRFVEAERLAYTVQVAASVAEARQALHAQSFDLVLLDRALQDGTGFDLLEAVGRTPVIFVTGADSPEIAVEAMKRGASDYLLKDQERRYLRLLPVAVERALQRTREEHERQEFQSRMQRSQKMEAIGTLAGGIAHEFNNILAIILSYAELSKLECDACPALVPNLDEVIKAAWRAKDVVQQIQTFNLEHSGDRAPVKVEPVVQDVCQLLRNAIPRGIQLATDGVSPHAVILANRGQVRQALMNVCNNARQALPAVGGRIQIHTHTLAVEVANAGEHGDLPPGRYVRLSVQDNGCGMDAATLARVVEPFFTTRPPGQGSGLGMSAVLGIMRAHGGTVTLHSQPGAGTTVHLYFPTSAPAPEAAKPGATPLPAATQRRRVMLIDDEASLLLVNGKFLSRMGHEVQSFQQAEAALAAFALVADAVDLVITDLNMPGVDGLTLVERMRQLRPNLPVLLMTGFADEQFLTRVKNLPQAQVLQKPVLAAQLGEAVQKALGLGGNATIRPAGPA